MSIDELLARLPEGDKMTIKTVGGWEFTGKPLFENGRMVHTAISFTLIESGSAGVVRHEIYARHIVAMSVPLK